MKVSLVIPAYNEEERLRPFLDSIAKYALRHRQELREVIVVDDGSKDKTAAVAESFKVRIPGLKVIKQQPNQGKGAAVRAGVLAARGDQIVFMDADGATAITELPKMIDTLSDAEVAVGNRWMRGAKTQRHSRLRRFSGWLYRTYMRIFVGPVDTMCGFKGYQKDIARSLFQNQIEARWLFDTEIAYRARLRGYKVVNFPIRWESKDGSKLNTFTLIKSAIQIWPLLRKVKKQEK